MEYTWFENEDKTLMFNGFNTRIKNEMYLKARWNIIKQIDIYPEYRIGNKEKTEDYATDKNFDISYYYIKSKLSFQNSVKLRTSFEYTYKDFDENITSLVARHDKLGLEMVYSIVSRGILTSSINWIKINYNGPVNSPVTYEFFEGYKAGINYYWELYLSYNFQSNLVLNINYNGRKSENSKAIHTGNINLRYIF